MNEKGNFLKTSLLTLIKASVNFIKKYWLLLSVIINIFITYILLEVKLSISIKVIIAMCVNVLFLVIYYLYRIYQLQKYRFNFPTRTERYTVKYGNLVSIEYSKKFDALQYLCEVEDYLENMGVYVIKGE